MRRSEGPGRGGGGVLGFSVRGARKRQSVGRMIHTVGIVHCEEQRVVVEVFWLSRDSPLVIAEA